jgi:predicted small lipoprotein YifL
MGPLEMPKKEHNNPPENAVDEGEDRKPRLTIID